MYTGAQCQDRFIQYVVEIECELFECQCKITVVKWNIGTRNELALLCMQQQRLIAN